MTSTMLRVHMRVVVAVVSIVCASFAAPVYAQGPPPPIPWVVVDVHASVPKFPADSQPLADSRGMALGELPGSGLGGQLAVQLYPLHSHIVTIGIGGELAIGRSKNTPPTVTTPGIPQLRPAEERFTSLSPQLSLNFGNGSGWSYLSVGLGQAVWSLEPEGLGEYPPNSDKLKTLNYGGGARWFIKPHVAFSFDVRFYAISPGFDYIYPGTPRTSLLVIGAGISLK
jgi:hypothetical protein